jgi:hypothetical protein
MTVAPYNITLLSQGTSVLDTVLVFNYWSDGILFGGLLFVFVFIILAGTRYAEIELENSLIYASFFGAFVGMLGWVFRYQGVPAIPTFIPILFIFILGFSIVFKLMKSSIKQID